MKLQDLTKAAFLATLSLTVSLPLVAQNPPATTHQAGFYQPVARFNPKQRVKVKLINNTDISLDYDNTDVELSNPKTLAPGKSNTLKDFGDSAFIVIYLSSGVVVNPDAPFTLKFDVTVDKNNMVIVTITKASKNFLGHRTVNLQKTGAIYIY